MSKPILFNSTETSFTNNGFGRLSDAISCVVEEKLNGKYELEMVYPVNGIHFSDLQEGRFLFCPHDETGHEQPFEIFRITRPINGKVTVFACHLSYKLNKMLVKPFTVNGVQTALSYLTSKAIDTMPFTFSSDKTNTGNMDIEVPTAIKSVMGGMEGSIIDVYGGEWDYDFWHCDLRNRRGSDTGVNIRYGKNLTDVKKVTDQTNLWTGIVPFWRGNDPELNAETVIVYNGIIYSNVHNNFPYPMNIAVDASSAFDEPPTQAQLLTWGNSYVSNNAKSGISSTIDISFVQLWQTKEYKNVAPLQRLHLGDTVDVFYEKLGINNTARVVAYKYNVLLNRYDSMTIGEVKSTLATTVQKGVNSAIKGLPSKSFFELALERATTLITGGYGGYVVINTNEAGQPNEILVMNTNDKTTATQVMRINYQGIAFGTGYNGPFNSAWTTLDGTFDAQNINVVNLTAAAIVTGILQDQQGNNYWNMDTGEFRLASTVTVGGSTVSTIASNAADAAVSAQTQQSIFNKLTNNGQTQGIYLSNGKLYLNATYMNTGALDADLITTGKMQSNNGTVYFDLDNNELACSRLVSTKTSGTGVGSILEVGHESTQVIPATGQAYMQLYKSGYATSGLFFVTDQSSSDIASLRGELILEAASLKIKVYNDLWLNGDLSAVGSKSRIVDTDNYSKRLLYCYEMANPVFGDIGCGMLDDEGICYVEIDDIFAETARTDIEYQVFLQKEGQGDLWVAEKNSRYFLVEGTPNLNFSWEVKAKQIGYEQTRIETPNMFEDENAPTYGIIDYDDIYNDELSLLITEQEEVLYETA